MSPTATHILSQETVTVSKAPNWTLQCTGDKMSPTATHILRQETGTVSKTPQTEPYDVQ